MALRMRTSAATSAAQRPKAAACSRTCACSACTGFRVSRRSSVAVRASAEATPTGTDMFNTVLNNNKLWSEAVRSVDPQFFTKLSSQQSPKFLWLGCSDSRVPANQILGLSPGEVFVQRNVGNQVHLSDMNIMSCMEFAVNALGVKVIIVNGHYNCGAVRGALTAPNDLPTSIPLVNCWIHDIRQCRDVNRLQLEGMDTDAKVNRLCELNVLRQTFHVVNSPVVQAAWAAGKDLTVYGSIYSLSNGLLMPLVGPLTKDSDLSVLQACVVKTTNSSQDIANIGAGIPKLVTAK